MKISVVTLFPELYEPFLRTSLIARARENGLADISVRSLFEFCSPKERVDAPTFGHGAGMVLRPDVIERAVIAQEQQGGSSLKVFFSPQGKKLDQEGLKVLYEKFQQAHHVMLLPARYEGMDARIEEQYADEIISIGDFVLMGGDIPAMALLEGLLRFVPGVVGKQESVERDSFSGSFVDYPEYTEPVVWHDKEVPAVVRSGNHKALDEWRQDTAAKNTVLSHFQWLRSHVANERDVRRAQKFIPPHYAVIMHSEVMMPDGRVGESSVTSLDIHDIARSAKTYGLVGYFVVTPLVDQQKIAHKLLEFWHSGVGVTYNPSRHEAVSLVRCVSLLDEAIAYIEEKEGKKPLLLATSAQEYVGIPSISYQDQQEVWSHERPVLFVFGTAKGLAPQVMERCDYFLPPVRGFSQYNHLSVRTAAGIIFDRWLGITVKKLSK